MNDTLREALEALAERAETAEESGGTPPGEWMNGFNDGKAAVAESLRAILAAHPADTETEFAVRSRWGTRAELSEKNARITISGLKRDKEWCQLVKRTTYAPTEWQFVEGDSL